MPRDMFAYARSLAAHKRTHPADDVMTVLATDADLTAAELEMFFFLLTVAGNDTVRSAAPGGLLELARSPRPPADLSPVSRGPVHPPGPVPWGRNDLVGLLAGCVNPGGTR